MNKFFVKRGLTLVEVMISAILILLTFILVYRTFFTVNRNIMEITQEIKNRKRLYRFLSSFKYEIEGICDTQNLELNKKEIDFFTFLYNMEYPVEIKYVVEKTNEGEKLVRIQRNLLTDYEFKLTALEGEDINFLFYINDGWEGNVELDKLPSGIAIEINYKNDKIFFPIFLNLKKENEKKE
ncbi:MAG: hypothetical protein ACP5OB_05015 [Candidatus Ratteibacteria bacterium]